MRRDDVERMRNLLVEAVTALCRSGLKYSQGMRVEGLLGITLDEEDVVLVNINKSFSVPGAGKDSDEEKMEETEHDRSSNEIDEASRDSEFVSEEGKIKRERQTDGSPSPRKKRKRTPSGDQDLPAASLAVENVRTANIPSATQVGSRQMVLPSSSLEMSCSQVDANVPTTSGVHKSDTDVVHDNSAFTHTVQSDFNPDNLPQDIHIQNAVKIEINSSDEETEDPVEMSYENFEQGEGSSNLYAVPVQESMLMFGSQGGFPMEGPSGGQDMSTPGRQKDLQPTQCDLCQNILPSRESMLRHKRRAHGTGKTHSCPHCNYVAKRKDHYHQHLRVKHGLFMETERP